MELDGEVTIGRDPAANLALADSKVSRSHATLTKTNGVWRVVDNVSQHGTFVNKERVESMELQDGDQLQVGNTILVYREAHSSEEIVATRASNDPGVIRQPRHRLFYQLAEAARSLDDGRRVLEMALATREAMSGQPSSVDRSRIRLQVYRFVLIETVEPSTIAAKLADETIDQMPHLSFFKLNRASGGPAAKNADDRTQPRSTSNSCGKPEAGLRSRSIDVAHLSYHQGHIREIGVSRRML